MYVIEKLRVPLRVGGDGGGVGGVQTALGVGWEKRGETSFGGLEGG